jgi:hypothetical protein
MSENAIAVSLLPLIFVLVLVLECSRLRCACQAPRRHGGPTEIASATEGFDVADAAVRSGSTGVTDAR